MKNNILYKIVLSLFDLMIIIAFFWFVRFWTLSFSFDFSPVAMVLIYVLVYRALANIITRKNYKDTGFNGFAKFVSIIVCIGLIYFIYSLFNGSEISVSIYLLLLVSIPLLMIWALDRVFRLKYEIKDKKYIILFVLTVMFVIFGFIMLKKEYINYTLIGSAKFAFYVEAALIPICLVNIYTLLVVRETNKENKFKENKSLKKDEELTKIEKPKVATRTKKTIDKKTDVVDKPKTTRTRKTVKKEEI